MNYRILFISGNTHELDVDGNQIYFPAVVYKLFAIISTTYANNFVTAEELKSSAKAPHHSVYSLIPRTQLNTTLKLLQYFQIIKFSLMADSADY